MSAELSQRRIRAFVVILFVTFLTLVWVPWLIQDWIAPELKIAAQPEWIFWLQTFSGNWAPSDHPPVSHWAYAFSAIVAVIMNNALGLIVIGLLWRSVVEWRQRMKLKQVFAARDQAAKEALYKAFPEEMEKIREAFKASQQLWRDEMILLFGSGEAERLQAMLNKDI